MSPETPEKVEDPVPEWYVQEKRTGKVENPRALLGSARSFVPDAGALSTPLLPPSCIWSEPLNRSRCPGPRRPHHPPVAASRPDHRGNPRPLPPPPLAERPARPGRLRRAPPPPLDGRLRSAVGFLPREPVKMASRIPATFQPDPAAENSGIPIPCGASGGEEGIRTHERILSYTPLAGERLRPLGHLSEGPVTGFADRGQAGLQSQSPGAISHATDW